jgi:NAD(P)-dependent dehydrogenase (short-subunit alcohol dehydrogenase family)
VARVLIVGCGCRGRALAGALRAEGHAVRGTTRREERLGEIEAAGAEAVIADPDRLGTIVPLLEGVSVLCWLVIGARLEALLERLVDTPVRGFLCDGGEADSVVRSASERWRIPVEIVEHYPGDHAEWLAAATRAMARLLAV